MVMVQLTLLKNLHKRHIFSCVVGLRLNLLVLLLVIDELFCLRCSTLCWVNGLQLKPTIDPAETDAVNKRYADSM